MNDYIKDLIQILKEEISVYHQVLEVLRQEKTSLVHLVIDEIYSTANEKELLAVRIKSLEEARKVVLEKISVQIGINKEVLTISFLATLFDEPESSQLLSFKNVLLGLINEVTALNAENNIYLENSIRLVQETTDFLRHYLAGKANNGYKNPKAKLQGTSVYNGAIISHQI